MIQFFRKIRKSLLSQNRLGKYLLYAIGEILLVVIGILIALKINNWNQDQKDRQREVVILQEILNSVNDDLELYEITFETRLERKQAGVDSLMSYVFDPRPVHDSLINGWYREIKTDILVRYDDGPFEALKSTGLDIIRTDSLRLIINDAYSSLLPTLRRFTEISRDENNAIIESHEKSIIELRPVIHDNGDEHLHTYTNVDDLFSNEDFLWVLYAEQNKLDAFSRRSQSVKRMLKRMKTALDLELEK